jgi:hypothetical protein
LEDLNPSVREEERYIQTILEQVGEGEIDLGSI